MGLGDIMIPLREKEVGKDPAGGDGGGGDGGGGDGDGGYGGGRDDDFAN